MGLNILVVDDDPEDHALFRVHTRKTGYKIDVLEAYDAGEGLYFMPTYQSINIEYKDVSHDT
jgi:CheY-like chemotaxis protein